MSFNSRKSLKNNTNSKPTYLLTTSAPTVIIDGVSYYMVNEGDSFTIYLTTTNLPNGTVVRYIILNVASEDISGANLLGNFIIDNNTASVTFNVTEDLLTEDYEEFYLLITDVELSSVTSPIPPANGHSISIFINDTSLTPSIEPTELSSSDIVVLGEEYLLGLSRPTTTYPIIPRTSLYEDLWKIKSIKIKSNPIDPKFNKTLIENMGSGYVFFKSYRDSDVEIWIYSMEHSVGYNIDDYSADSLNHIHSWQILLYNSSNGHIHLFYNRGLFIEGNKLKIRVFPFSGWEKKETDPLTEESILDEDGNEIYTPVNFEFEIEYNTQYVSPYIVDGVSPLNLTFRRYNESTMSFEIVPITQKPTALYLQRTFSTSSVWWLAAENRVYRSSDFGKTWSGSVTITASKYISTGPFEGYSRNTKIFGFFATGDYLYAFTNNGIYRNAFTHGSSIHYESSWTLYDSGLEVIAMYNVNSIMPSFMTSDGKPMVIGGIQNPGANETLYFGFSNSSIYSNGTISMTHDLFLSTHNTYPYVSRNSNTQTQNAFHTSYFSSPDNMSKGFIVNNGKPSWSEATCYVGAQNSSDSFSKSNLFYNIIYPITVGYDVKYGAGYFDDPFPLPAVSGNFIFLPDKDQIESQQSRKIGYTSGSSPQLLREELQLPVSDNWIQFFKVK